MNKFLLLLVMSLAPLMLYAQEGTSNPPAAEKSYQAQEIPPLPVEATPPLYGQREWTTIEVILSVSVLIFAFLVLCIEAYIAVKAQKPWSPQSITRAFGLTMILSFSILLIVAGYDKDQTAPSYGPSRSDRGLLAWQR
ncbi:MAG: hypothetical protein HC794_02415 [Nitrospiraceae bacterium]|nr:hypothetical protein [Nitrospiraceae bacterium]